MGTGKNYLEDRRADVVKAIASVNEAITKNDVVELNSAQNILKEAEAEYAKEKCLVVIRECLEQPNPVQYAVKVYSYETVGHKDIKDNGILLSCELDEHKVRTIDLRMLTTQGHFRNLWFYEAEEDNIVFILEAAIRLGFSPDAIKKMNNSIYMSRKAGEYVAAQQSAENRNPISKRSLLEAVQSTVDNLYAIDGVAPGTFKVNSHDIEYIKALFFKKGKDGLTLASGNASFYGRLLMDVCHRIQCGLSYGIASKYIGSDGKATDGVMWANYKEPAAAPAPASVEEAPATVTDAPVEEAPAPKKKGRKTTKAA